MDQKTLFKIKQFIRVSQEIEVALGVTAIQKQILLTLIDLHSQNRKSIAMGDLANSIQNISERSFYRHIKTLIASGWIKLYCSDEDHRIKLIEPSPRLLKTLSSQI